MRRTGEGMAKKREAAQPQEPQGENEDGAGFEELLGQTEELVTD